MTFVENFQAGHLVLPAQLLGHYSKIFTNADDFLVWQFVYLQNTTNMAEVTPSQIGQALGRSLEEINHSLNQLISQELLLRQIIELNGEVEVIFDASPALRKLDDLLKPASPTSPVLQDDFKGLVKAFEQEFGRMLSPFEIEDLQKTIQDDGMDKAIIREALREAVLNGKLNWRYIQAILRNWHKEGIRTLRQVEERRKAREATQPQNVSVSDDFLNAMNLWSDS